MEPRHKSLTDGSAANKQKGKKNRANNKGPTRKLEIRKKMVRIYEAHNPSKLGEIDSLMKKYEGREESLLQAIQTKYVPRHGAPPGVGSSSSSSAEHRRPWQFNLKHYSSGTNASKKQKQDWNIDESLAEIRPQLDELAASIGGECAQVVWNGQRKWVVREVVERTQTDYCGRMNLHDSESVTVTVDKMRELVHNRYEYSRKHKSKASYIATNEHDRRKEEKHADQEKKKRRGRGSKSPYTSIWK